MKTTGRLKLILGLSLIAILGFTALSSFTKSPHKQFIKTQDTSVNITIDSNTTDDELNDINTMLSEHGITAKFSNIERNDEGQITGIKIELKDGNGNSATSEMSSSNPINNINFGRKNGSLYITQGKGMNNSFAFLGNMPHGFNFDHDSILQLHLGKLDSLDFDNMFNFDDNTFFFNGKELNMDELMDQMQGQFQIEEDQDGNKHIIIKKGNGSNFFFSDDDGEPHQKFRFVDNSNTEKLIVIDGKESDFKTLDDLAKKDQLESVDVLQSKTAISIYGNKAKDGAIIATTKQ